MIKFIFVYIINQKKSYYKIDSSSKSHKTDFVTICAASVESPNILQNPLQKLRIEQDNNNIHIHKKEQLCVICIAQKDTKLRICNKLMEAVHDSNILIIKNNRLISKLLNNCLTQANDPSNDMIMKAQEKVSDIKESMNDNMNKMFEDIEDMEVISANTELLEKGGEKFETTTKSIRRSKRCQYIIIILILMTVILIFLTVCIFVIALIVTLVISYVNNYFSVDT